MIHSIVSLDDIFYSSDVRGKNLTYRNINGGVIGVSDCSGEKRIERLFSTDPYMYLDKRYMPYKNYK